LRSRTHFQRYRGRRFPFSCFVLLDSFLAVPSVLGPVFMFCAPGVIFGGSEGVGSPIFVFCTLWLIFGGAECVGFRFHVLRAQTHFRRYRGHLIPSSCFLLLDMFSAVPSASCPVFMFCSPRTSFWWYRGRRVLFSCFALPDTFSAVRRTSGPIFMFCACELIFGGTDGVGSRFHVLRSRTRFQRCRVRRVPFSCFAWPDSFSAILRASDLVFIFSALEHVLGWSVGPTCQWRIIRWMTPQEISLLNLLRFIHLEWTGGGRVFIPLTLA
jgi:hypothetical protein